MRGLIIEDHSATAVGLAEVLASEGVEAEVVARGDDAVRRAQARPLDLIVLDLRLPGLDGVEVCRQLRVGGVRCPVLMLTGRASTTDVVRGLEAGADDYLVKPAPVDELRARIRALLRRGAGARPVDAPLRAGAVELAPASRRAWCGEREVALTVREFDLLAALVAQPDRALSREQLLRTVWDAEPEETSPKVVDVYVGYVRRKLGPEDDAHSSPIETVRGVGYRLRATEAS